MVHPFITIEEWDWWWCGGWQKWVTRPRQVAAGPRAKNSIVRFLTKTLPHAVPQPQH
jgi:hypothetical protein